MELSKFVDIYKKEVRPKFERKLSWHAQQPDLETAMDRAARATNSQGKRYKHQRRIDKDALPKAREALLASGEAIRECQSFDELHDLIEATVKKPIDGIGPLYVYDTTLRIGAYLGLMPTRVYLQCGAKEGAENLSLPTQGGTLSMEDVPQEFKSLHPHEIEDLLCIFKDDFNSTDPSIDLEDLCNQSICS